MTSPENDVEDDEDSVLNPIVAPLLVLTPCIVAKVRVSLLW
eukprot:CAMPEP_0113469528 /NCGR_PEP_ID=MMETSP0014_2-20120614/15948_1 /TAXON_ID=2857 /ORGANISM="Nitzschia sp." /LENGTH=40 /DNA_ID=CAMNT_0000362013 /DNA_START=216 /DNA_END=335 /DNA_ORIENTATION=- /assembly_acc=CAM_ASM_000159